MHNWTKRGPLAPALPEGFTERRAPCALALGGGAFALAFTALDEGRRSHVFVCRALAHGGTLSIESGSILALQPGELGHFDEAGAMSSCFASHGGATYLYYTGWQLQRAVPFTFGCGRALFDTQSFTARREFAGPVMARNHLNPLLCASPFVLVEEDQPLAMWYVSGLRWEQTEQGLMHHYTIRRAVSEDGLRWESDPAPCIPPGQGEYAIARPSVLRDGGRLCMWFCHRGLTGNTTYRIGLATSSDGVHWERHGGPHVLDVSLDGWDSGMVCYPHVFAHEDWLYMLYNGDGFGASGFGYAVARRA